MLENHLKFENSNFKRSKLSLSDAVIVGTTAAEDTENKQVLNGSI